MRSIFAGMIILSASMAVVLPARAQRHSQRPPTYGYLQTPMDPQQSARDDLKSIEMDNRDLELPASREDITGADQAPWLDGEIRDICPSCGSAEDAVHQWSWPIYNGFNHQPTQDEQRALRQQDVRAIKETDRLYDRLMSKEQPDLGPTVGSYSKEGVTR